MNNISFEGRKADFVRTPSVVMPIPHLYPDTVPRSQHYQLRVDGVRLDALSHSAAHHASVECTGLVHVEIDVTEKPKNVVIRPLSCGISPQITEHRITFSLRAPQNVQVEVEGLPLLYLYALAPAKKAPIGPNVRIFEAGRIHQVGLITLGAGEICWIEPGAIVRGSIRAYYADKVQVGGYGVLDGGYWVEHENRCRKALVFDHCTNVAVEDLLMLGPSQWMITLGACHHVSIRGVRQIANDMSSDGIDIAGSTDIRVKDCCLHNGDDNIAIKAIRNTSDKNERAALDLPFESWNGKVEDVVVTDCIFYNILGGSAMEIGYETSTEHIHNIRFENIDVLGVHGFGSVFGIHNGDRARVEDVTWDHIRVDHHYDKLVDFRVIKSRWNVDTERGTIRNVKLQNVKVRQSLYNEGYTMSSICGYDADHPVESVSFRQFELGGRNIANADDLSLATRNAEAIHFLADIPGPDEKS